jgi:hypothetical protein
VPRSIRFCSGWKCSEISSWPSVMENTRPCRSRRSRPVDGRRPSPSSVQASPSYRRGRVFRPVSFGS